MSTKTRSTAFFVAIAFAAFAGYSTVLSYSGDPNNAIYVKAGTVCTDTSTGSVWVKTSTTAKADRLAMLTVNPTSGSGARTAKYLIFNT